MQCIAFCCFGIEDVLMNEVQELIGKKAVKIKGGCIFQATELESAKFAYLSQSIERAGILLKSGKIYDDPFVIDIDNIESHFDYEKFMVSCHILGNKLFNSNDIVIHVSQKIKEKTGKTFCYDNGDIKYSIQIIDDDYYFFIDFSKKELSKRDYKIFPNKDSLRGTIAYATARIAEISNQDEILDCFTRSGEIAIESVHYLSGKSVNYYVKDKFFFSKFGWKIDLDLIDKEYEKPKEIIFYATDSSMPNLRAAEKNSKVAGVNKKINFSRINIEDLDIKFYQDCKINKIVTQLPSVGKETESKIISIFRTFFSIAPKISRKGKKLSITCIGRNIRKAEQIAILNGFVKKHERTIMQGKEELLLFVFER